MNDEQEIRGTRLGGVVEDGLHAIRVVQFLRPNGWRRDVFFDRPMSVWATAEALRLNGVRLEAEVLYNGVVSLTAEWDSPDGYEETVGHELVHPDGDPGASFDLLLERSVTWVVERLSGAEA